MNNITFPQLVAHRGYSKCFPENTLLGIEQALAAGACMVECDVQLTRDHVPVVLHDAELVRTTGTEGNVHELEWRELAHRSAGFQQRFPGQFDNVTIPLLSDLVSVMQRWSTRKIFFEIKRSSLRQFGREPVLQRILEVVSPIRQQAIIISFDFEIIAMVKEITHWQTGWVIEQWDAQNLQRAQQLHPDYLFVDYVCLPPDLETMPPASWQWVLYEIDDPQLALDWNRRGVSYIETNDIGHLLQLPEFKNGACHDNSVL